MPPTQTPRRAAGRLVVSPEREPAEVPMKAAGFRAGGPLCSATPAERDASLLEIAGT